jgi:hypothetical protein
VTRLGDLYREFKPHERLQLIVEALARRDQREVERLHSTTSYVRLVAHDPDVTVPYEFLERCTKAAVAATSPVLAQLTILDALAKPIEYALTRTAEDAAFAAWQTAEDGHRDAVSEAVFIAARSNADWLPRLAEQLSSQLRTETATIAHGWATFTEQKLEFPLLLLLDAFAPTVRADIAEALTWTPNADDAAELAQLLGEIHDWETGDGPKPTVQPPDGTNG